MTRKPPTAVFKCTTNSIIDEYEATINKLWAEYIERAKVKEQELGKPLCSRSSYDGVWLTGYVEEDKSVRAPAGWRRDAATGFIVPNQRSKAGKALALELESISYRPPAKPGLPSLVWGDGYMGKFGMQKLDGDWWATVTVPLGDRTPEQTRLCEVDEDLWEPSKMSAYYAALEAEGVDE
jgi:hypothetical protein